MIDDQKLEDTSPLITDDINNLDHSFVQNAMLPLSQSSQQDQEDSQISKYQAFSKFLIRKLNRRDLRTRLGPSRPPKNPIVNEPHIKSTESRTTKIQLLNQPNETNSIDKIVLTTFNVEKELERVKIAIPLSEISKNPCYKNQVLKWIQSSSVDAERDVISLQDEKPSVVFGPNLDMIDENVPPFYVTLKVHDFLLYNCMLDSGTSHNLMPKVIMDQLQLEVT